LYCALKCNLRVHIQEDIYGYSIVGFTCLFQHVEHAIPYLYMHPVPEDEPLDSKPVEDIIN
jgi:hypothetical protein